MDELRASRRDLGWAVTVEVGGWTDCTGRYYRGFERGADGGC